ncbi:hypothetical [Parasynechococcus marenigrum WH 8102]|uniref:Uncharacterized protein n=1 Tax=Parasynechococcus marenigrum (strain WH8102) TaxID=84588 RepID=Q7U4P9_PARMW|nr:hypothetical [Parasynechococcus marenigrum WH 8102]
MRRALGARQFFVDAVLRKPPWELAAKTGGPKGEDAPCYAKPRFPAGFQNRRGHARVCHLGARVNDYRQDRRPSRLPSRSVNVVGQRRGPTEPRQTGRRFKISESVSISWIKQPLICPALKNYRSLLTNYLHTERDFFRMWSDLERSCASRRKKLIRQSLSTQS